MTQAQRKYLEYSMVFFAAMAVLALSERRATMLGALFFAAIGLLGQRVEERMIKTEGTER